jgi:predicted RNA-binding protein (virulence factor B family)
MEHELEIGRFNELRVVKELHHGAYLDGGDAFGEILLPAKASPKDLKNGDKVSVFLYYDSEDRVIATTVRRER